MIVVFTFSIMLKRSLKGDQLVLLTLIYLQLYLLLSIAQFFFPNAISQITKDWFTTEEVSAKRKDIAELIESLARDKLDKSSQVLPNLLFVPPNLRCMLCSYQAKDTQHLLDHINNLHLSGCSLYFNILYWF